MKYNQKFSPNNSIKEIGYIVRCTISDEKLKAKNFDEALLEFQEDFVDAEHDCDPHTLYEVYEVLVPIKVS